MYQKFTRQIIKSIIFKQNNFSWNMELKNYKSALKYDNIYKDYIH